MFFPKVLFAAALLSFLSAQSFAATISGTQLSPNDSAIGQSFGYSVGLSGNTAIIGARFDDEKGEKSGAAYIFDVATGKQLHKLVAVDASPHDSFGYSVAISGSTAIVGAHQHDGVGFSSGAAYLFDVSSGKQIAKLTATDAALGDLFGYSVAISGDTAIVGSHHDDDTGFNSGAAYLFDTSTGKQIAKLTADDGTKNGSFGRSVSISNTTAIVGAIGNGEAGTLSGSAYLFDLTTGDQIAKLTANDASANDIFGRSVAISEGVALIGADGAENSGIQSGSAYLFDVATGEQIAKLVSDDAGLYDYFGLSVAISGGKAAVGAYANDAGARDSGAAYIFDVGSGQQIAKVVAPDAEMAAYRGISVALSDDFLMFGAPDDSLNNPDSLSRGAAYVVSTVPPVPLPANILLLGSAIVILAVRKVRVP